MVKSFFEGDISALPLLIFLILQLYGRMCNMGVQRAITPLLYYFTDLIKHNLEILVEL